MVFRNENPPQNAHNTQNSRYQVDAGGSEVVFEIERLRKTHKTPGGWLETIQFLVPIDEVVEVTDERKVCPSNDSQLRLPPLPDTPLGRRKNVPARGTLINL